MTHIKTLITLLFSLFICVATASPPPSAHEIFQLSAKTVDPNTFTLHWHIKSGYFLYKNRIKILPDEQVNFHLGTITLPQGEEQKDNLGNTYWIYRHHLYINVSILGEEAGEALLPIQYQGCADNGFCYPPQKTLVKVSIDKNLALSEVNVESTATIPMTSSSQITENEKMQQLFASHNWVIIALSFFGFGLLLAFTPCVLPMVPVLSGIIVGHGDSISTRKAFFLSLSYVLSMSFSYALVGAVVALMGKNIQIAMQSPWSISIFSFIFVLLALSMFGFYELRLPIRWQTRIANITRHQSSGHYLGAAIMGALSTLVLSPCVTAPLIGALSYIAQSCDITLGIIALFFLGIGMGTPLLLIGTSAGKLLPHAGSWMLFVKAFFGVMMLAIAIYLIGRIIPPVFTMGLWASLLIFTGIYTGAFNKAGSNQEKFRQGLGIMLLVYGLLILIGASQGNSNPLQPLILTHAPTISQEEHATKASLTVHTLTELQKALADAKLQKQAVMLDFYADWCSTCKVIASTSMQDPRVRALLNQIQLIVVDVSANTNETEAMLHSFNVIAPPTFLFYSAQGEEIKALRLAGEVSANDLYAHLKNSLKD